MLILAFLIIASFCGSLDELSSLVTERAVFSLLLTDHVSTDLRLATTNTTTAVSEFVGGSVLRNDCIFSQYSSIDAFRGRFYALICNGTSAGITLQFVALDLQTGAILSHCWLNDHFSDLGMISIQVDPQTGSVFISSDGQDSRLMEFGWQLVWALDDPVSNCGEMRLIANFSIFDSPDVINVNAAFDFHNQVFFGVYGLLGFQHHQVVGIDVSTGELVVQFEDQVGVQMIGYGPFRRRIYAFSRGVPGIGGLNLTLATLDVSQIANKTQFKKIGFIEGYYPSVPPGNVVATISPKEGVLYAVLVRKEDDEPYLVTIDLETGKVVHEALCFHYPYSYCPWAMETVV